MRIKQIDYYVNEDHRKSEFPPVHVEKPCFSIEFKDLQDARKHVDKQCEDFKKAYYLPDAVATMHVANEDGLNKKELEKICGYCPSCCKYNNCISEYKEDAGTCDDYKAIESKHPQVTCPHCHESYDPAEIMTGNICPVCGKNLEAKG